jgi:hypothetical protein
MKQNEICHCLGDRDSWFSLKATPFTRSTQLAKTALNVSTVRSETTDWIASRRASCDGNSTPSGACLTHAKKKKSDGTRSGEYHGCGAISKRLSRQNSRDFRPVRGLALSAWTMRRGPGPIERLSQTHCLTISIWSLALNFWCFGSASTRWKPCGFQTIGTIILQSLVMHFTFSGGCWPAWTQIFRGLSTNKTKTYPRR